MTGYIISFIISISVAAIVAFIGIIISLLVSIISQGLDIKQVTWRKKTNAYEDITTIITDYINIIYSVQMKVERGIPITEEDNNNICDQIEKQIEKLNKAFSLGSLYISDKTNILLNQFCKDIEEFRLNHKILTHDNLSYFLDTIIIDFHKKYRYLARNDIKRIDLKGC